MRRIAVELSVAAIATAVMVGLVLIAGSAIGSAAESLIVSYTVRPSLCTPSYCEPPELVPTTAMPAEPPSEAKAAVPDDE